jgi:hypothetical protein
VERGPPARQPAYLVAGNGGVARRSRIERGEITIPLRHGSMIVLPASRVLVDMEKPIESNTDRIIVLSVTMASLTIPVFCPPM